MTKYELVKHYYTTGQWGKKAVKNAVLRKWITKAQYAEITGEEYDE